LFRNTVSVSCPTVKLGEKMEREDLNGKFHDSLDPESERQRNPNFTYTLCGCYIRLIIVIVIYLCNVTVLAS